MKTPSAHIFHNIPCGCATESDISDKNTEISVCQCGAAYLWLELITFPPDVFRCYDCGRVYSDELRIKELENLSPTS